MTKVGKREPIFFLLLQEQVRDVLRWTLARILSKVSQIMRTHSFTVFQTTTGQGGVRLSGTWIQERFGWRGGSHVQQERRRPENQHQGFFGDFSQQESFRVLIMQIQYIAMFQSHKTPKTRVQRVADNGNDISGMSHGEYYNTTWDTWLFE